MKGADLRSFIEQAPISVAMFDRDMRYIAVSRRWLSERNLDGSIIGRTAYEVYPDVAEMFREEHLRALAGETVRREEDRFDAAHGVVEWVRSEVLPWREADGEIGGVVVFAEDITARKRAEEALRNSEERFRYAVDASQDGIWDWNLKTGRVACSPAFRQMLGYEASEWDLTHSDFLAGLLHPDDRREITPLALELLKSPGRYELELRLRARDGSYRSILSRGKTVERDESGAPLRAVGTHTDITERKAIEEALRVSREEVRKQHEELDAIYQNAPIGLASLDPQLRHRRINRRLAEIVGRPPGDLIGKTLDEVVPAMAPLIKEAAQEVLEGKKVSVERQLSGETPGEPGVTRYFVDHWYPVFDEAGGIAGCGVVVDEITERKKIELELQQASERLELAQSAANIGIWEWNLETNHGFVNDQWRLIYGVPKGSDVSFDDFVARLHPDDKESFLGMVQEAFAGSGAIVGDCRIIRGDDGETRWVSSKGRVFFGDDGRPLRGMGAVWDITPFKLAQEALLRRSEGRYKLIVETAQEGIWLLDTDANTSFVNPRMAQLLGYSEEEMLGRPLLDFMDAEWRANAEHKLIDRAAGVVETHDFKFLRKDGSELWALLSCSPIFDGNVYLGALAMVMDFSERKRLEEDRQRFLESLKQTDRRKDEFLATMGHELRTPLATIALAADVIEADPALSEKSRAMCSKMQRQVHHLKRMVDDVLQVSRMSLGKIDLRNEDLDLGTVLAQVRDAFQARFERGGLRLSFALPKEALIIHGDELRLTQVFGNILDNALKYTDRGGSVDLALSRTSGEAVVTVSDTGIGIPPGQLAWVFEIFNQMKHGPERAREGIGVGLALARKLVELHGGSVAAESEGVGKGSKFVVRLPLKMCN